MKNTKENNSRRSFLEEGFKLSAGLIVGAKSIAEETTETVKMLTADGKVVEVRASQIKRPTKKTKNKEILDWIKNPNIKKSDQ